MTQDGFASIEEAVRAIGRGEMVIVVDDPDRENEGDLVMAAAHADTAAINFMAREGRGLICVSISGERLTELGIPPILPNDDPKGTAFHVSVDSRHSVSTGISASDRANTIRALADDSSVGADFSRPGHVFPLAAQQGGVLARAGHTEASADLCELAGLPRVGVICEIADENGEMARLPSLLKFAEHHELLIMTIADLIAYRRRTEQLVHRIASTRLPLAGHEFTAVGYRDSVEDHEHIALVLGDLDGCEAPLVRVHSECLTGDVFGSDRCDCGTQLADAIEMIGSAGCGAVIYIRGHEGRGIGLLEKLRAYELQDQGMDTVEANIALGHPADRRDYGIGMQILADLGVSEMRLLTNNPAKRTGLEGYGLKVRERVPLPSATTADNVQYLRTKRDRMGHQLPSITDGVAAAQQFPAHGFPN
jgi:3,4-dihydroxy 2-butanone 4-phosphate synthase/GTP cyclohydrolase II